VKSNATAMHPAYLETRCIARDGLDDWPEHLSFRGSLLNYWEGACAVTGIALPALLRASHAKPWAECATDAERLNIYNGFLLCAHLDALFDRGLLTFTDSGTGLLSPEISEKTRTSLNLNGPILLRWCSPHHVPFLQFHRQQVAQFQIPPV
jgi:hypothetical protein